MANSDGLLEELDRITTTLGTALDELAALLKAGKRDDYTDDTLRHAKEMADILTEAVSRLDDSVESNAIRGDAAQMCAQVALFGRDLIRTRLH